MFLPPPVRLRQILFLVVATQLALPALVPAQNRPGRRIEMVSLQAEPASPQFQALPLERSHQNHLLVRAHINGKPALLGVDTGAPISAVAINRRAHFGMPVASAGSRYPTRLRINGAYNQVAVAKNLRLGALNLVDEPMVVLDLGNTNRSARVKKQPQIDGILGADILFPTKAVLDCKAQTLIMKIDPSVSGSIPGMDYSGHRSIPMTVSSGYNLYVDGTVNGVRAKLMVDTGAFATLLHYSFVQRMRIPMRESPYSSAGVNVKQRGVQLATINKLSIGSVKMHGKEVGVMDLAGLVHDGMLHGTPPVAGLLGSEILRRHNGIIDFGTQTLYLKR